MTATAGTTFYIAYSIIIRFTKTALYSSVLSILIIKENKKPKIVQSFKSLNQIFITIDFPK